ncbi:MAG: hypothetical protein I4O49_11605, partial [Janthinobacterium lividum]|nr:hypothetical protein [Janthinobacterium lividum]
VPQPVIKAARKHLARLEAQALDATPQRDLFAAPAADPYAQEEEEEAAPLAALNAAQQALLDAIADLDPDALTPRDALEQLYQLKRLAAA